MSVLCGNQTHAPSTVSRITTNCANQAVKIKVKNVKNALSAADLLDQWFPAGADRPLVAGAFCGELAGVKANEGRYESQSDIRDIPT
ncbi:hypothetical protein EVAR_100630_1 [Eumeta japonica]|uniref:Uncharacterized protein n=1 Tax=Eumeta variegata TaxID=151549 RepID=A0A4C2A562_EUMVA|nr:hypothetical protein EVAR_100630_1 [Eumeta japonica]